MEKQILLHRKIRDRLNSIGPGMCLAKWTQVTLHLHNGHTHSCHHPNTHLVPLEEIAVDPSALHNTIFKKAAREEMLTGSRPNECHYCWNVEDNIPEGQTDIFSDRVLKTSEPWSLALKDKVFEVGHVGNINPSYLEVSFSHGCNFKCAYCSPQISSKWMEEIQQFGPYPTSLNYNGLDHIKFQGKMPIPEREENPYVEAFWKWWPDLYPTLDTFRVTGGEPLMTKHMFRVLDYVIENPNPNLNLAVNSNLGVPSKLFDQFIDKIKVIQEKKLVKSFTLFTSCEAYGNRAEYIRFGLDYKEWLANCQRYLSEVPSGKFSIMSTYNALSVSSYMNFLKDVLKLKLEFSNRHRSVGIDVPYLDHPKWMNVGILPMSYQSMLEEQIEFVKSNHADGKGFQVWEYNKLERIMFLFSPNPDITHQRDFYQFFNEHDARRATDFLATFPEMADFWHYCKSLT